MQLERQPRQVAQRALILGALAFRASLEVTDDARAADFSRRLLPWLDEIGCSDEIDPIERQELATPLGQLSDSEMIDVNWAGEAAWVFCWMLGLAGPRDPVQAGDQSQILRVLPILQPSAAEFIRSASLRSRDEIEHACWQIVLIHSMLRER